MWIPDATCIEIVLRDSKEDKLARSCGVYPLVYGRRARTGDLLEVPSWICALSELFGDTPEAVRLVKLGFDAPEVQRVFALEALRRW